MKIKSVKKFESSQKCIKSQNGTKNVQNLSTLICIYGDTFENFEKVHKNQKCQKNQNKSAQKLTVSKNSKVTKKCTKSQNVIKKCSKLSTLICIYGHTFVIFEKCPEAGWLDDNFESIKKIRTLYKSTKNSKLPKKKKVKKITRKCQNNKHPFFIKAQKVQKCQEIQMSKNRYLHGALTFSID